MIYHDIVRLDIPVHDTLRVAEVERFEEFEDVEPHVEVGEFGVEGFEFGVLNVSSCPVTYQQASGSR